MSVLFSLKEVAEKTGIDTGSLRRRLNYGDLTGIKEKKGSREVWYLTEESVQQLTSGKAKKTIEELTSGWIKAQQDGRLAGKPLSNNSVRNNRTGLKNYWKYAGTTPSLKDLNAINLENCFANMGIDRINKKCFYSSKHQIYKGVCSFLRYLIKEGYKTEADLLTIKKAPPRRVYPEKKTKLTVEQLQKLIAVNDTKLNGRTEFDIQLTKTILFLGIYAGLRRDEILNLEIAHLRLEDGYLDVIDGKNNKNRKVGISPELKARLVYWLEKWRPKSTSKKLLLQQSGNPVTSRIINTRVKSAGEMAKLDITPHGLRQTFATIAEVNGMPMSLIHPVP